jgi:hypothetical protein
MKYLKYIHSQLWVFRVKFVAQNVVKTMMYS